MIQEWIWVFDFIKYSLTTVFKELNKTDKNSPIRQSSIDKNLFIPGLFFAFFQLYMYPVFANNLNNINCVGIRKYVTTPCWLTQTMLFKNDQSRLL